MMIKRMLATIISLSIMNNVALANREELPTMHITFEESRRVMTECLSAEHFETDEFGNFTKRWPTEISHFFLLHHKKSADQIKDMLSAVCTAGFTEFEKNFKAEKYNPNLEKVTRKVRVYYQSPLYNPCYELNKMLHKQQSRDNRSAKHINEELDRSFKS